jgi:PAS domain S-box-containing protein
MPRSNSLKPRVVALALVQVLVIAALWWGINHEVQKTNKAVNDVAELKDPSPFRAALNGYLGKIQLGMQGYLRSADPSLAEQMLQARKDFLASLPEFQKQNSRLFPPAAVEEIRRAFSSFESSLEHTLKTHTRRMEVRGKLDQNFSRILYLIDKNIKPLIRDQQTQGEERRDAILNVENLARAWQQNLVRAWAQPSPAAFELTYENDNRGSTYLDRYSRMELLQRERKLQKEIQGLWAANGDLGRESFAMEKVVKEAEEFMNAQRGLVVTALNNYLPALPPNEFELRKQRYVNSIRMHLTFAFLLGLIGAASLVLTAAGLSRLKRGLTAVPRPLPKREPKDPDSALGPEPTLQMDLKGNITRWSASAERLYGYTETEMRGQPVSKLFESESEISRLYQDLLNAPQTVFQTTHRAKNGNLFRVRIEFRPISDSSGKASSIGLLCSR